MSPLDLARPARHRRPTGPLARCRARAGRRPPRVLRAAWRAVRPAGWFRPVVRLVRRGDDPRTAEPWTPRAPRGRGEKGRVGARCPPRTAPPGTRVACGLSQPAAAGEGRRLGGARRDRAARLVTKPREIVDRMSFLDAAQGGLFDERTATEMSRLLREAADIVDAIPRCDDVKERVALWRRLADVMGTFDGMLPEQPAS